MADELLPLLGIHVPPNDDDSSDSNSAGTDEEDSEMEQEADVANGNQQEAEGGKKKNKRKDKKSTEASRSMSFDSSLPSSHTYLGTDLEEISGRTILEDDSVIELPLVTLPGTILVPGHIIPLYSHMPQEVAMLKSVLDSSDKTFGVVPGCRFSKVFGSKSLEKNLGVLEQENAKLCY